MNAYYQLKSKQNCGRVFLEIKMLISACFMQEVFWIDLVMIEFRLIDCGKSQSIATNKSSSY